MKNFTAFSIIKQFEGLRLNAYTDEAGVITIGYGHTATAKQGMTITVDEAQRLLLKDIEWAVNAVNRAVRIELSQNMFDALVSLCFNIGETNFLRSTVVKRLNNGDYDGAAKAFELWNKVRDRTTGKLVVSNGLVNRRKAEVVLFKTPDEPKRIRPANDDLDMNANTIERLPRPKVAAGMKAGGFVVAAGIVLDTVAARYGMGGVLAQYGGGELVAGAAIAWIVQTIAAYQKRDR